MIKGYYFNQYINPNKLYRYGNEELWVTGLKAFDSEGVNTSCQEAVWDSLNAYVLARDRNDRVPVLINSKYWMLAHDFEIAEILPLAPNDRILSEAWCAIKEGGQRYCLKNNATGEVRNFSGSVDVVCVRPGDMFLTILNHDESSRKTLGLYSANNDKWLYEIEFSGEVHVVHEEYLIEMKANETLVRSIENGNVHGQMPPMKFIRLKTYCEQSFTVVDRATVHHYDIAEKKSSVVSYTLNQSSKYYPYIQGHYLVVFCPTDNTVQIYDLRSMEQTLNTKLHFEDLVDESNRYLSCQKANDLVTFVRNEESEFIGSDVRIKVRYFFDPDSTKRGGIEVEELKAKHEKVLTDNHLHDYRIWFESNTPYDTFYRQAVTFIEAVCIEYGFSLVHEGPYDEYWSGDLILDTTGQNYTEKEYAELNNLIAFLELKITGAAKPVQKDKSNFHLILS